MSVLLYPSCPEDCAGSLPDPSFNECAPVIGYGEISKIYLAKADAADFTNIEDLSEWTTRLALGISSADAIRAFTVMGDLPEAEATEITISGNRTIRGFKKFTMSFEIDEDNDENYQAHLTFECNTKFKMWIETADGMMFGGNEGLIASILTNYLIPRGRTEIRKIMGKAVWESKKSPLRNVSPLV
jgi:hypothetical protein